MATTPYGIISKPLDVFRTMLSYSAHFQAWVEETDGGIPASGPTRATACLDYIHTIAYQRPSGGWVYPAAIIELPNEADFTSIAVSADAHDFNTGTGAFDLTLVREVPTALLADDAVAWQAFAGQDVDGTTEGLGPIIDDLRALTAQGDYLNLRDIALIEGPWRLKEDKAAVQGNIMGAKVRFTWGFS